MPKRGPNKRYTGEFKQMVVETMQREHLGYLETARRFELKVFHGIQRWERIYLEEGLKGYMKSGEAERVKGGREDRWPQRQEKICWPKCSGYGRRMTT
jgi:transposase-like protein